MPPYKQVDTLRQMCFMLLAKDIHKISVDIEESKNPKYMEKPTLNALILGLPSLFVEQMIVKVIETLHNTVQRHRRAIGLQTCLEVLLQPHITRLDLSGLFFKMRLPVHINSTIRSVVCEKIVKMSHLSYINLVSKCDDEILLAISKHCFTISDIVISISDLVTDKGILYISKGCPNLERLEIYKCWGVSPEGVKNALVYCQNLCELHCDELGSVFLHHLKGTQRSFKLKHFEQTCTTFEPTREEAAWIGQVCPDIQSVRLATDDEFLFCLPKLGKLRVVELELTSIVGEGFTLSVPQIASTLTTLHLSCEVVHQKHIILVGKMCKQLTSFNLITATINDDQEMKNTGEYFTNLTSLHLQIWKESFIRVECIDFFLLWCFKLSYIVVKAQMDFFTDNYLRQVLEMNPFRHATKINITSDKYVPLTMRSVRRLLSTCPLLEMLSVSSWDVSEEEFLQLGKYTKDKNYFFTVT